MKKANAIETLISTFIAPLPLLADENDRIHCSLNLNTETGRLSARKPNLQVSIITMLFSKKREKI